MFSTFVEQKYNKMNYPELAQKQFSDLREATLDDDRKAIGAGNRKDYEIGGEKCTIEVNGFWEKSVWFDWTAYNEEGEEITNDTEVY